MLEDKFHLNYCRKADSNAYDTPYKTELTRRAKDICPATTIRAHVIANVDLFTSLNRLAGSNIKTLHTAAMVGRVEVIAISTDGVKETK